MTPPRIELISEIATNHGGNLSLAKEFIDRFADAGADWIKFQYTRVQHLRPDDPQYAWFQQAELSDDQFAELKAHTEAAGAKCLLTVYNHQDVPAVRQLCDAVKIGSGEWLQDDLLRAIAAARFTRVIHSGPEAVQLLGGAVRTNWEHLRCIARYPTLERAALRLTAKRFEEGEGWSDHVIGLVACEDAIMNGARLIEKHVQLDHQARPSRPFEATVSEFKHLRTFADDDPDVKFRGRWQFA